MENKNGLEEDKSLTQRIPVGKDLEEFPTH